MNVNIYIYKLKNFYFDLFKILKNLELSVSVTGSLSPWISSKTLSIHKLNYQIGKK